MLVYTYNTCMDTHIQVYVTSQVFSYSRIQVIILSPLTVLVTTEVLLNTRGHASTNSESEHSYVTMIITVLWTGLHPGVMTC